MVGDYNITLPAVDVFQALQFDGQQCGADDDFSPQSSHKTAKAYAVLLCTQGTYKHYDRAYECCVYNQNGQKYEELVNMVYESQDGVHCCVVFVYVCVLYAIVGFRVVQGSMLPLRCGGQVLKTIASPRDISSNFPLSRMCCPLQKVCMTFQLKCLPSTGLHPHLLCIMALSTV